MAHYRCEESYKTDFCDVDFKDELKISALLSRFESIASKSADELEFGYKYLKEHGYAFFLAEIRCVLSRAVPLYETLLLRTWPTPPSYVVFGREYEGYAESGEKILSATSRWCAVEFSTGKLLTPKAFPEQDYRNAEIYDPAKSGAPQTKTAKLSTGEGEKKFSIKIANSEYDHNMHVNNTHYADYCLNCFSVAELDKFFHLLFETFDVMVNRFSRHHLTHVRSAGGVAYHARASAEKSDGAVSVFLHPRHNRNVMTYMQTVRRRVESDVKSDAFGFEFLSEIVAVNGLFYKSAFFENVHNVFHFFTSRAESFTSPQPNNILTLKQYKSKQKNLKITVK